MNYTDTTGSSLLYKDSVPFVPCSESSKEAAESVKQIAGNLRERVFGFICSRGYDGATCDEVEIALGLRHQTASARCRELVQQDLLTKRVNSVTGKPLQRPTRSGRNAVILFDSGLCE